MARSAGPDCARFEQRLVFRIDGALSPVGLSQRDKPYPRTISVHHGSLAERAANHGRVCRAATDKWVWRRVELGWS
jgi:hypothetical protein